MLNLLYNAKRNSNRFDLSELSAGLKRKGSLYKDML